MPHPLQRNDGWRVDVPCIAVFVTITGHGYVVWSGNGHERGEILGTISDDWRAVVNAACLASGAGSLDEIADELDRRDRDDDHTFPDLPL